MSLFERDKSAKRKKVLEFYIIVENISEDEFLRLKEWIKENIPSTERFTPRWSPNGYDKNLSILSTHIQISLNSDIMTKVKFRFKHEEHAMAFKLIV